MHCKICQIDIEMSRVHISFKLSQALRNKFNDVPDHRWANPSLMRFKLIQLSPHLCYGETKCLAEMSSDRNADEKIIFALCHWWIRHAALRQCDADGDAKI